MTWLAGYLAIVFGFFGALAGVIGAGTFIPFRSASTFDPSLAELLTGIAVVGAALSVLAVIGGWGLVRGRDWGWSTTFGAAIGCIGPNAAVAALWHDYAPFLGLVVVAYALVFLLLLFGRPSSPGPGRRPRGLGAGR